jgi:hypothetical protein
MKMMDKGVPATATRNGKQFYMIFFVNRFYKKKVEVLSCDDFVTYFL